MLWHEQCFYFISLFEEENEKQNRSVCSFGLCVEGTTNTKQNGTFQPASHFQKGTKEI